MSRTIYVLFGLCLVGFASYLLWLDLRLESKPETKIVASPMETSSIAKVKTKVNVAEVKNGHSLQWRPILEGDSIVHLDKLKTGSFSSLVINLSDSNVVIMEENTLIQLKSQGEKIIVERIFGKVRVVGSGDSYQSNSEKTFLKNEKNGGRNSSVGLAGPPDSSSKKEINRSDIKTAKKAMKSPKISKTKSKTKAKTKAKTKFKTELDNVRLSGMAQTTGLPVLLETPVDRKVILNAEIARKFPFHWTVTSGKIKSEFFELSHTRNFKVKETLKIESHQSVSANVPEGKSFWRVGWKVKEQIFYTLPRLIEFKSGNPIFLMSPKNNRVIELQAGDDTVEFKWSSEKDFVRYSIDLSNDYKFTNIFHTQVVETTEYKHQGFSVGAYYWRVHAFDKENNELALSIPYKFIFKPFKVSLPNLIRPNVNQKWRTNQPLLFKWENFEGVSGFQINISRDKEQKKIVLKENLKSKTRFSWKWKNRGTFYWSVKAFHDRGMLIGKSETRKVQIIKPKKQILLILLAPKHKKQFEYKLKKTMEPIQFEWTTKKKTSEKFHLRVSESENLNNPIVDKKLDERQFSFVFSKSGKYFWQVEQTFQGKIKENNKGKGKGKNERNNKRIEKSPMRSFYVRLLTFLYPTELLEPINKRKFTRFKKIPISFVWKELPETASYRLFLEKQNIKTNSREEVLKTDTLESKFTSPKLAKGIYFWKVIGINDKGQPGTDSPTFSFEIEINEELVTPILAPAKIEVE